MIPPVALLLTAGLYGQTSASSALERAEAMHEALQRKPVSERPPAEYRRIAEKMLAVWQRDSASSTGQEAEYEAGTVYVGLAVDQHDRAAWKAAVDCFATLLKDRPYSAYRRNAEWALAQIEFNHLGESRDAQHWLKDFTHRYPADPRVEIAHQQLRGERVATAPILGQRVSGPAPLPLASAETARRSRETRERSTKASSRRAEEPVSRHESAAKPESAPQVLPLAALPQGRLHEVVFGRVGDASPHGLNQILGLRVRTEADKSTVVVELSRPVHVVHASLPRTHRYYFDLHDSEMGSLVSSSAIQKMTVDDGRVLEVHIGQNRDGVIRLVIDAASGQVHADDGTILNGPPRFEVDIASADAPRHPSAPLKGLSLARNSLPPTLHSAAPPAGVAHEQTHETAKTEPDSKPADAEDGPEVTIVRNAAPAATSAKTRASEARKRPAMAPAPPPEPEPAVSDSHDALYTGSGDPPTRDGSRSLTRVLGLKIHKIVLDAGHGGHDTGTIGPGNLYEKDVVLDVTRRLGRLLQDRLGMDVVYTRKADVFIPLQERTAIANDAHADLFLSIHANSSDDASVRGIETYYLDFTHNPRALAVAARENATGELSTHSLQTLIQRIALNDKQQESREFAGDLLTNLVHTTGVEDRGVKSAPFVVLIGARMPSVLTEISFLSDPTDARLLRKPNYRERIAEALYHGVANYLDSLNGVHALKTGPDEEHVRNTRAKDVTPQLREVSERTH